MILRDSTASTSPRYRMEGGQTCIDIKLRNADQLFDGRDPAPFRDRDLDDDALSSSPLPS